MRKSGSRPAFLFVTQLHMLGAYVLCLFVIVCGIHFDSCFFIGVLNISEVIFHQRKLLSEVICSIFHYKVFRL